MSELEYRIWNLEARIHSPPSGPDVPIHECWRGVSRRVPVGSPPFLFVIPPLNIKNSLSHQLNLQQSMPTVLIHKGNPLWMIPSRTGRHPVRLTDPSIQNVRFSLRNSRSFFTSTTRWTIMLRSLHSTGTGHRPAPEGPLKVNARQIGRIKSSLQ